MKKLEDVFVSAAARGTPVEGEICLDGSERRMLSKVKGRIWVSDGPGAAVKGTDGQSCQGA